MFTNEIIRDNIDSVGAQDVGKGYVPLGSGDFTAILEDIKRINPDSIVLPLVGLDSNKEILRQYHEYGLMMKISQFFP